LRAVYIITIGVNGDKNKLSVQFVLVGIAFNFFIDVVSLKY